MFASMTGSKPAEANLKNSLKFLLLRSQGSTNLELMKLNLRLGLIFCRVQNTVYTVGYILDSSTISSILHLQRFLPTSPLLVGAYQKEVTGIKQ